MVFHENLLSSHDHNMDFIADYFKHWFWVNPDHQFLENTQRNADKIPVKTYDVFIRTLQLNERVIMC